MPFYMMGLVSSGGLEIKPLWIPSDDYTVLKKKKKWLNLLDLLFATSDKYMLLLLSRFSRVRLSATP